VAVAAFGLHRLEQDAGHAPLVLVERGLDLAAGARFLGLDVVRDAAVSRSYSMAGLCTRGQSNLGKSATLSGLVFVTESV
jgi:hypothetical protein